ncbi:MAG: PAS domain S-box protein, partial [Bacteroidia bacterium]
NNISDEDIQALSESINEKEKAADENYLQFKSLIENAIDIIYRVADNGKFIYINPIAESVLGYSPSEFFNFHFTDIIHPDHKKRIYKFYKNQAEQLIPNSYIEFPVETKSGEIVWLGQHVQLIFNKKGEYEFTALARDITDIKSTHSLLEESNNRLSELITNLHYGVLLSDEKGKVVLTNQVFCNLFNLNMGPEQIIGADFGEAPKFAEQTFADPKNFIKVLNKRLAENKLVLSEEILLRDGKTYERDFIPLYKDGVLHGHLWQYRDVTEMKNTTDFLKWNEEKYRSIIENMGLGIIEVDPNQKIMYVNNQFCKDTQYTSEELTGQNAEELLLPAEARKKMKEAETLRKKGQSSAYEIQLKRKDGSLIWMLISGTPKYNTNKKNIGSIGIHLDISNQKNTELELRDERAKAEQSKRAKEIFLANMSHEIRTPMNAIIGFSRLLKEGALSAKQFSYLDAIISSSENLLVIINDILDFSKIESGKISLEEIPFNLETTIERVIKQVELKSLEKSIALKVIYDPKLPKILIGDPFRVGQVLLNLVNNSVKFTRQGSIKVICSLNDINKDSVNVSFKIADTGIGIKKEILAKIFEDFIQADDSINRKYGGTGLGLTISKQLIELMGGEISVESVIGLGTIFTFSLSFKIASHEQIPKKEKKIVDLKKLTGRKILLAEDNEFNQMLALSILESWEADVSIAKNGKEALDLIAKNNFDIILMDIQMPEMDGIEATKIIRKKLKFKTPILALTANAFKTDREKYMKSGVNDYITKPFDSENLYRKIVNLLPKEKVKIKAEKTKVEKVNKLALQPVSNIYGTVYTFDKLKQGPDFDTKFLLKMSEIFIKTTTKDLLLLNSAFRKKDFNTIKKIAHKLKSSMDTLKISSLHDVVRKIENYEHTDRKSEQSLGEWIQLVVKTLNIVIKDMQLNPPV